MSGSAPAHYGRWRLRRHLHDGDVGERRRRLFVLAFAAGCVLSSIYGFLFGTWPFDVVEVIWTGAAARRYLSLGAHERDQHASANLPVALASHLGVSGWEHYDLPQDAR